LGGFEPFITTIMYLYEICYLNNYFLESLMIQPKIYKDLCIKMRKIGIDIKIKTMKRETKNTI